MGRKKVVKDTTIQETPVIFFLRIQENVPYDVLPAGEEAEYTELPKPNTSTNYSEILQSVHGNVSMNSELLKDILDKTQHTEYSTDTSCFWCCSRFHWAPCEIGRAHV